MLLGYNPMDRIEQLDQAMFVSPEIQPRTPAPSDLLFAQKLSIHPNSVCFKYPPEWVIFHEIILTSKEFMREVSSIQPQWLPEIAPHFYETKMAQDAAAAERIMNPPLPSSSSGNPPGILHYSPF